VFVVLRLERITAKRCDRPLTSIVAPRLLLGSTMFDSTTETMSAREARVEEEASLVNPATFARLRRAVVLPEQDLAHSQGFGPAKTPTTVLSEPLGGQDPRADKSRPRRKKDKVRSAWISFTGRIVAQLVGAGATVWLGLHFVEHSRKSSLSAIAATASAAQSAASAQPVHVRSQQDQPSVAVLPFQNLSGDTAHAYLADGLTSTLITELSAPEHLSVRSLTSSMAYKGQTKSLPTIANELGADFVIEGTCMRVNDRIRVTVRLFDAAADRQLWARTFDEKVSNVLEVQDAIAREACVEVSRAANALVTGGSTVEQASQRGGALTDASHSS
jgi:TolB-like protein